MSQNVSMSFHFFKIRSVTIAESIFRIKFLRTTCNYSLLGRELGFSRDELLYLLFRAKSALKSFPHKQQKQTQEVLHTHTHT